MENQIRFLVLEYSPAQQAWHINQIYELINKNLLAYLENRLTSDYVIMGVGRTHEELHALQQEIISTWKMVHPEDEFEERGVSHMESIFARFAKVLRRWKS